MAGGGLPPPPTRAPSGDFAWIAWYNQLYSLLNTTGSVSWSLINFAGSRISDIADHSHDLLSGLQGGTTGEHYHLTAAEHTTIAALPSLGTMASQNANTVAITGGTIDNTVIGGTTPAAGTFTTLIGGSGSANYGQLTGSATTKAVEFKTLGSDTNVAYAIRSKGTGAIDLAAGSSGVNISNGGTVTAITGTNIGASYTSFPSVVISAPTTAGGVQATASVAGMISNNPVTIASGGTGYTVGDTLTVVGGTSISGAATLTVNSVSGGVITAVFNLNFAGYTVLPTNPVSVTGGTGSGATFNLTYSLRSASGFTITNAGSGYVEQPTVSFSGGGGSGAAAYASVGSATTFKTLGASLDFYTPNSAIGFRVADSGNTGGAYWAALAGTSGNAFLRSYGTAGTSYVDNGSANSLSFRTNAISAGTEQLRVAHTASAVNYVQVTGAATGGTPTISVQGSDANINLILNAKGSSSVLFQTAGQNVFQATGSGIVTNRLLVTGTATGVAPSMSCVGGDTNIDLTLTPKGTGVVQFGTYTVGVLAPTGYITIKDFGGTTRRLLVG